MKFIQGSMAPIRGLPISPLVKCLLYMENDYRVGTQGDPRAKLSRQPCLVGLYITYINLNLIFLKKHKQKPAGGSVHTGFEMKRSRGAGALLFYFVVSQDRVYL